MKRFLRYSLLLASMTLVLASCENDDTDMDDIIAQYQVEPATVELDFSFSNSSAFNCNASYSCFVTFLSLSNMSP